MRAAGRRRSATPAATRRSSSTLRRRPTTFSTTAGSGWALRRLRISTTPACSRRRAGPATSTIAPAVTNTGTIEVSAGTLDFGGGIIRNGIGHNLGRCHAGVRRESRGRPDSLVYRQRRRTRRCTTRRGSPVRSAASTRPEPDRTTRSRSPAPGSFPASRRTRGARREPWGSPTAQAPSASPFSAITTPPTSCIKPKRTEAR